MSIKNSTDSYGTVTKVFHWGIALSVYFMLGLGYFLDSIRPQSLQDQAYMIHQSIGLTILLAIILRFVWRMNNTTPTAPSSMPTWQRFLSRLVHYSLYAVLLAMPFSGWIMATASGYAPSYFGLFTLPMPGIHKSKAFAHQVHDVHEWLAIVIITLVVIHVLAALKHHFIDKDNVLKRMLPGNPSSATSDHSTASSSNVNQPEEAS